MNNDVDELVLRKVGNWAVRCAPGDEELAVAARMKQKL